MTSSTQEFAKDDGNHVLLMMEGEDRRRVPVDHFPFRIGRQESNDLVVSDPTVSRMHAEIVREGNLLVLVDAGSRHGITVNSRKVDRWVLQPNDRIEFGRASGVRAVFDPPPSADASSLLDQLARWRSTSATDLDQLRILLEAVRRFHSARAIEEIYPAVLEFSLQITNAERAYLFTLTDTGSPCLAYGRNRQGERIYDDSTISHSVLVQVLRSGDEILVADTQREANLNERESIQVQSLRSIVCIPLLRRAVQPPDASPVFGVLYLDSQYRAEAFGDVGRDVLRSMADDAARLLENAHLVLADEKARRYEQELAIATRIQEHLLSVHMPACPFAEVSARTLPCKEVGGDFFDVIVKDNAIYVVFGDVCGKGVAAALMASILQGTAYAQFLVERPLAEIAQVANHLILDKCMEEKYATAVLIRIDSGGHTEVVNCGHVAPLLVKDGRCVGRTRIANLPIGMFVDARFEVEHLQLAHGDQLMIVSDGVTEAENCTGEFFGESRLVASAGLAEPELILQAVLEFASGTPLSDDCSILQIQYHGSHEAGR